MKIRNSSSKAFHSNQASININKNKALSVLLQKINQTQKMNINQKQSISAFKKIISSCYNNKIKQQQLCNLLNLPFIPGPVQFFHNISLQISLNSIPASFFNQQYLSCDENKQSNIMQQLNYLFDYLKKTKEYYYCWIIYYNQQLKILTIKMMKKYQLEQNVELLNKQYCLIGIFVDKQLNINKYINNNNLIQYQIANKSKKGINKHSSMSYSQNGFNNHINKSCYEKKTKTKTHKILSKIKQKHSQGSFQTIKSQEKTNSSSFQKENINKVSSEFYQINKNEDQKKRNFKKKKVNLIVDIHKNTEIINKVKKSISKKILLNQSISQAKKIYDMNIKQTKSLARLFSPDNSLKSTPKIINNDNSKKMKILRSISNKGIKQTPKQNKITKMLSPQHKQFYKFP